MTDEEHISDTETEATANKESENNPGKDEEEPSPVEEPDEICVECGKPITIATVKFQDKPYHPDCFVCSQCQESLCGKLIYKVDNKRVDKVCYCKFFARKCATCDEALIDPKVKYLSYGGLTYHGGCFCCVKCNETLAGKKFYALDQGNTCENCYGGERRIVIEDYNDD